MSKPAVVLLISALCLMLASCTADQTQTVDQMNYSTENGVVYYDIFFEIDPQAGIIRSEQKVTITGNLAEGDTLAIFLGEEIVIDKISLENEQGTELTLLNWEKVDSHPVDYWWGKGEFSKIALRTKEKIPPDLPLVINVAYHLPEEEIQEGRADNFYDFFASLQGSHAGGPESGAFPLVSGDLSAPFSITIAHPNTFDCAVPGERVVQAEEGGYSTVTYQSKIPYDPSFSCAVYKIIGEESGAIQVELYTPAQHNLSSEMVSMTSQILLLYQELFGGPAAESFRTVFPD